MAELQTADVWQVLDLICAEFQSDPLSVQCFDSRLVARALELNANHKRIQVPRTLERQAMRQSAGPVRPPLPLHSRE